MTEIAPLPDVLSHLPLFPLPETVFFPGTLLPLHIFEERYRALTRDALQADGLLGIVLIKEQNEEIHRIGGVGKILHHELLPDGRYHLLVQGLDRFEILAEEPQEDRLYRRARVRICRCESADPRASQEEFNTLQACCRALLDYVGGSCTEVLERIHKGEIDFGTAADFVCASMLDGAAARQEALAEVCITKRLKKASEALAEMMLSHSPCDESITH